MNSVKKNKTSFDEKLHSLKLNVTKRRLIWLLIPVAIILVGVILVSTIGFNLGIDFTGGTIINVVPNEIDISEPWRVCVDNLRIICNNRAVVMIGTAFFINII